MKLLILVLIYLILKTIYNYYHNYQYASLIIPNLWLGNKISSMDKNFLQKNNIGLIINCSKHLPFTDLPNISKYRLNVHDNFSNETENRIIENIEDINNLIDKFLSNNKGVLIHCHAGMQRAPTVTSCYIMHRYKNNDINKVINFIKQKRSIAFKPIINYFNTLVRYRNINSK